MGKGGGSGRGKGKGKGGCDFCCEAVGQTIACVCCILFLGPILIAIGIALFVSAAKDERNKAINTVQDAMDVWLGDGPNSINVFKSLQVVAQVSQCAPPYNVTLTVDTQNTDRYLDKRDKFQGKPQARFTGRTRSDAYCPCNTCSYTVYVAAPGSSYQAVYTQPFPGSPNGQVQMDYDVTNGPSYCPSDLTTCSQSSTNTRNCIYNCNAMGAGYRWDCVNNQPKCYKPDAYYDSLCLKINNGGSGWFADSSYPSKNHGCSAFLANMLHPDGQYFQVPNPGSRTPRPSNLIILVRAASDPWLTYVVKTSGTLDFGTTKSSLVIGGVVCVIAGALVCLCWLGVGWYCVKVCCRKYPTEQRPSGYIDGRAWDVANRYGYTAVGVPVAQGQGIGMQPQPAYGGQPYPGQPYPAAGQPYPAQPYPGQPYPGAQPYATQPQYPGAAAPGTSPPAGYPEPAYTPPAYPAAAPAAAGAAAAYPAYPAVHGQAGGASPPQQQQMQPPAQQYWAGAPPGAPSQQPPPAGYPAAGTSTGQQYPSPHKG